MEPLGYIPPAEAEANYCKQLSGHAVPAWLTLTGLHESRGGSVTALFSYARKLATFAAKEFIIIVS